MTPADRADLAESMIPVACDLACRVRDGDAEGIARLAGSYGWDMQTAALLVVLAAMVDDTSPVGDLLAWTETLDVLVKWRQQPLLLPAPGRPDPKPCGTFAAARRHQRAKEPLDPACEKALREKWSEYGRNYRERVRRAGAGEDQHRGDEADAA